MEFSPNLMAQRLKPLPAMWETWVQSLGQEDPLEKEMATHSSILAWRIPWMEEPGGLQSTGSQRVGHDWVTNFHFLSTFTYFSVNHIFWFLLVSHFSNFIHVCEWYSPPLWGSAASPSDSTALWRQPSNMQLINFRANNIQLWVIWRDASKKGFPFWTREAKYQPS